MKIGTVLFHARPEAAILIHEKVLPVSVINHELGLNFPLDLFDLINADKAFSKLKKLASEKLEGLLPEARDLNSLKILPPYRNPSKIWSIGLNYREHSDDLREKLPTEEPASFMKPCSAIIGSGDSIRIPDGIGRVTAEAEMGIIFGRSARNVKQEEALDYVIGVVPVLDMTALDILLKNPRFLTRAKSYDTFFSFGPFISTMDEIPDLPSLRVSTIRNGAVTHTDTVDHMTFSPEYLIAFHSRVFQFEPGDILSPGTPGASEISPGDEMRCRLDIPGEPVLVNGVVSAMHR